MSVEYSKFVISRDATFDEKSLIALSKAIKPNDGDVTISNKQVIEIESEDQPYSCRGQVENPIASEDKEEGERDHEEVQQVNLVEYALSVEDDEPVTFKQAIKDKDMESWLVSMEEDMQSLHKNKTWEVV
ncbi:hypothetical protein KIW84_065753 [Lathyrus oleraceus]|uniref:Uncharacterized protein n=1 Tax=Pisum sativum TaxID=3888 RepID=A0A9D5ACW9_PEA|nr:hypothetical protein KIW84_065753 [Pisum sativum]